MVEREHRGRRVAVVTGSSAGIGAALVRALLGRAWTVIGVARRPGALDHPGYQHHRLDLADGSALESFADGVLARLLARPWQRVGLVNNAAVEGDLGGLERVDPAVLVDLLAVNTVAPVVLMGRCARDAPPGAALRIANVSSGAAVQAFPGLGAYGASKAALRHAGMTLAAELDSAERPGGPHPDAAVLSFEPGVVDTAMQMRVRGRSAADFPWRQPFEELAVRGLLVPPAAVVSDLVDFLESPPGPIFREHRHGVS